MKKSILLIACVGAFVVVFRLLSVQSPMERPDFYGKCSPQMMDLLQRAAVRPAVLLRCRTIYFA